MKNFSFHLLRLGMGITFLWIGILMYQQPQIFAGYLQPWAMNLLPVPIEQAMLGTAVLDIVLGMGLLLNVGTWVLAAVASFHLVMVLIVSGITDITVRDIGLLFGALALFVEKQNFFKNSIPS